MRRLGAVLIDFLAALLLAFGLSGPAAAAAPISSSAVPFHAYDNNAASVLLSARVSERGPPTYVHDCLTVNTTRHRTSARPLLVLAATHTVYDGGARPAQIDNARATMGTAVNAREAALRASTGAMVAAKSVDEVTNVLIVAPKQLQSKFKHAADFGVTGNYNKANAAQFNAAIQQHINAAGTRSIRGTYRGDAVTHFLDPETGLNVISRDGTFVSGWRLNADQLANVLRDGSLGGG